MNRYIIASFLGRIPAGTAFPESEWPLHVTLTRAFLSGHDEQDLIKTLERALEGKESFALVGKSEELFGPKLDRPVIELERTGEISGLNASLKQSFASSIDRPVPDKYPEYRPHVTRQGNEGIAVGDTVTVSSVSLIRANPDSERLVLATIPLV